MIRILIPIMTSILVSGCLEFGDDIRLAAPDVTASELGEVTRRAANPEKERGTTTPLGP